MVRYISLRELEECFAKVEALFRTAPALYENIIVTTEITTEGGLKLKFECDKGDISLVTQVRVTNYEVENESDV
jgi:hypothetical protein